MAATSNPHFLAQLDRKLKWAEDYLKRFESKIAEWELSEPYAVSKQDDPLHGRHIRRLHIKPIDYEIPLLLSDFVHNLRSSLDHIAWQLSVLGPTYPTDREAKVIAFPIHEIDDTTSQALFNRQTSLMPPDAVAILRDLQPHKRGTAYRDDPLWQLNKLWNIDKHRTLAMNGGHDITIYAEPRGFSRTDSDFDNRIEFSWPLAVKDQVVFKPYIARLVLGEPFDAPGTPFNIGKERVTAIHRYVRDKVLPRLSGFFPPLPNT